MKKLKAFTKLIEASSLTISIALQQTVINWLQNSKIITQKVPIFIASIFIVIIFFLSVELILKKLTDIKFIRSLILKEDFIEGHWAEIAYDLIPNQAISYTLLTITAKLDNLHVNGDTFSYSNGSHIGSFSSNSIHYEYPYLYYSYKYDVDNQINTIEGITRIKFVPRIGKEPIMHTGFFIDLQSGKKTNFSSWKITDTKVLSYLQKPESFHTQIKAFISKMSNIVIPSTL